MSEIKQSSLLKSLKPKFKKFVMHMMTVLYRIFYKFIKIDSRTVLFIAFHGKGYLCNPKYIHEYMSQDIKYKDFEFVWAVKNPMDIQIPNAKVIKYNSIEYFYYLAKSHYWVFNCKMPSYVVKKKNQVYLQTWHGTPLKRLGHDINVSPDQTFYRSQVSMAEMMKSYDDDAKKYDYFVSPNRFSTEKFLSA
ncbi:MAG TPA: teichoic acid biosynthesis protein F, partial [Firmicutes bacterium]|nr:teichoic acid biosynthesis protein F [Bacillota bacterium]